MTKKERLIEKLIKDDVRRMLENPKIDAPAHREDPRHLVFPAIFGYSKWCLEELEKEIEGRDLDYKSVPTLDEWVEAEAPDLKKNIMASVDVYAGHVLSSEDKEAFVRTIMIFVRQHNGQQKERTNS